MFKLIFEKVEDKNPANHARKTPLHMAANNGHLDVCRHIIENVEDKNPADHNGDTSLHCAANTQNLDIFRLIVEHIEDKNPRNNVGETPKDLILFGFKEFIELFEE